MIHKLNHYPKVQTLSELLAWSHYIVLLKSDDPLERSFYEKETVSEHDLIQETVSLCKWRFYEVG